MVSQRLYLSVEGDDEVKENTLIISKTNASKLNANEGDEIVYEDVPVKYLVKPSFLYQINFQMI